MGWLLRNGIVSSCKLVVVLFLAKKQTFFYLSLLFLILIGYCQAKLDLAW